MTLNSNPRAAVRPAKLPARPNIRWMIRRDMPAVLEIENQSFMFPWREEQFIHHLRQRNCIGMVAEVGDDELAGFMLYELLPKHLHVVNFAVGVLHRRKGVGAAMVAKLARKLSPNRRTRILLEVRETNLLAQLFFSSQGFRATAVLRDRFDWSWMVRTKTRT